MTLHFAPYIADIERQKGESARPEEPLRPASGVYRLHVKRWLDIVVTLCAAPLALPVVALMALMISFDGHHPFYSQMRIGRNGRIFRIWKLRTMVHDADEMLQQYLAENSTARLEWDMTQKLKRDPRITLVGRVLRKLSADELPQLLNVLNGTMSLVGPRPIMVTQKSSYAGKGYYRMRPGITGLWQVSARNESTFSERAHYDDHYDCTMSFGTDVAILMRTVAVVLRGTGY